MGLVLLDDSLHALNQRIREGDPTTGWRGDATMMVYMDEQAAIPAAVVVGTDGRGDRYVAARVALTDFLGTPNHGWRHDLLQKLREGDWQRKDVVDRLIADVEAPKLEAEKRLDEYHAERAEHLAWAIQRDLGHLHGGLTRRIF